MRGFSGWRPIGASLLSCLVMACAGCRGQPEGFARFVPASGVARKALTAALDAWQNGQSTGKIGNSTPTVIVVDTFRRPNQSLESYEVLGEVLGENHLSISVRLTLANPSEQPIVRFNVIGLDPIWVFREEDYDLIAHWEHHMSDEKSAAGSPSASQE